jgi:NAD+ kinase
VKVALQIHPTRIADELLAQEVYPHLEELSLERVLLPRDPEAPVDLPPDTDFILTLGGDGTFLTGARLATRHGLPILGAMVGRLGFLCTVTLDDLGAALRKICDGTMLIQERCVLLGRIIAGSEVKRSEIAVNDVVVHRVMTDNIRDLTAHHSGQLIAQYRADGILLSTAAGSTAYNMAAGGPLVHPELDLVMLTPICAHSLFTKPLVLPAREEIEIAGLAGSYPLAATFDGALRELMEDGDRLEVTSLPDRLKFYRPAEYDFYEVLRQKFQHGYVYGAEDA